MLKFINWIWFTDSKRINRPLLILLMSGMMHGGKVKGTDFVLFRPTMHQIVPLTFPSCIILEISNYGLYAQTKYVLR